MKLNIIRAMLDLNILFKSKYYDELSLEHGLYYKALNKYVVQKLDGMNKHEKLRYSLFKKAKGIKFGSGYSGVPYSKEMVVKRDLYPKKSYLWGDVGELYFDLPPPQEIYKESFI
jgi:hypothetical protein